MQQNELIKLFKRSNALLDGHFKLSSGLHSDTYFQSALILQYPEKAACISEELIIKIKKYGGIKPDVLISPAIGGIIVGYEMARILKIRSVFTERINDGNVSLRRGFSINRGEKVLIVEDVITTGLSVKEIINSIKTLSVDVIGIASLIDRSTEKINFGVPSFSLLNIEVKNYKEDECPMCKNGSKAIKLGSRK
ncbi:MAG: orotate phosphoribosyltransferase [Endomicrobium sp.]|jgi:orotate phosphoribosyltransferase|nr:orotate phosphoribosyltransferase [Endomicrobium sp.]